MMDIGRVCVKIAGRDAGLKCVVIDILDKNYVLVDGQTRRRKVNMLHLEPTAQILEVPKGASSDKVILAFKEIGVEVAARKPKKKGPAPRAVRKAKEAPSQEKKPAKKPAEKKLDEKVVKAAPKLKKEAPIQH